MKNTYFDEVEPIFINIPCPSYDEAIKLCRELLEKELCGTAKVHKDVHLLYHGQEDNRVKGEDIVLITLKSIKSNLANIHEYILKNHSWGTPCIEVVPITSDMC